jgi:hypothetical protein
MTISHYYFEFPDRQSDFHYSLKDRPENSMHAPENAPDPPAWTRLDCHRCAHCPLSEQGTAYCPAALDMVEIVEKFAESNSYDRVTLFIARGIQKHSTVTDLQTALAYLFPFVLLKSACPFAPLLRPLEKFIKPFPDLDDTIFYLLSFELVKQRCSTGDSDSAGGSSIAIANDSRNITMTLHGLLRRLRAASRNDANINGIIKDIQWSYCLMHSQNMILDRLRSYFIEERQASYSQPQLQSLDV